MVQFYKEYSDLPIGKQSVSQLEASHLALITHIPWGHHILLMQKIKDKDIRLWYMQTCLENGWSRDVLGTMLKNQLHTRQGNFHASVCGVIALHRACRSERSVALSLPKCRNVLTNGGQIDVQ